MNKLLNHVLDRDERFLRLHIDRSAVETRDVSRCPDDGGIIRNIDHVQKRIGADFDIIADSQRTQQNRARADKDVVADGRVPFADMLARPSERHIMKQDTIVADFGRLTYHHPRTMIDKKSLADGRPRMNLHPGEKLRYLREQPRNKRYPDFVHDVQKAMKKYRVKTGVQKKFDIFRRRIVAINRFNIFDNAFEYHNYSTYRMLIPMVEPISF